MSEKPIDHVAITTNARDRLPRSKAALHHGTTELLTAYLDLIERVLPSLRREHVELHHHEPRCQLLLANFKQTVAECNCGADEHNAIIDEVIGPPS